MPRTAARILSGQPKALEPDTLDGGVRAHALGARRAPNFPRRRARRVFTDDGGGPTLPGQGAFEAIEREFYRLVEGPPALPKDLDLFWYLWSGPQSPLFGKDRITTFERDFIADPRTHHETKNPYFLLIHEAWFCGKVLSEFGVDPSQGMIVNGHVPVKVEKGESPLRLDSFSICCSATRFSA